VFALMLSILLSSLVILLFRYFEHFRIDELGAITFNYLVAAGLGFLLWQDKGMLADLTVKLWLIPALVIGVLFIAVYLIMSRSAATAGITITAVASRMSVLIPVSAGFLFFREELTLTKLLGIILAFLSFYLVLKPAGNVKLNWKKAFIPLLLLLGIGSNDTAMKYLVENYVTGEESQFLTVVFFVSLLTGSLLFLYRSLRERRIPQWKFLPAGALLGLLNFGSTYFLLIAMSVFESSVLFPVVNMGIVLFSTLLGLIFFREKPSAQNWLGIALAIVAILLITTGIYGNI
jgi:drug/metabolite transporter (DMT)-like permease